MRRLVNQELVGRGVVATLIGAAPDEAGGLSTDYTAFWLWVPPDPPVNPDGIVKPYVLVAQFPSGRQWGAPLGDQHSNAELDFLTTSVGTTEAAAGWMQHETKRVLIGQADDRSWLYAIGVPGHAILDRSPVDPPGAVEPSEGLYQAIDSYTISVEATA